MYILGINSVYHESSVCLLKNGKIVMAVEEERFNRVKHAKELLIENPDELPTRSIQYCLEKEGITLKDIEWIGYSINPEKRLQTIHIPDPVDEGSWGSEEGETRFYHNILNVERKLRNQGFKGNFKWVDHHLCHAASAYYPSPFENAVVLAIDGIAETASTLIGYGDGRVLKPVEEIEYPSSIGFMWEKICKYLGFSEYDSCKVMGLAAYGDPAPFQNQFRKFVDFEHEGKYRLDGNILRFRKEDYDQLEELFGVNRRNANEPVTQEHRNIAATLQKITEDVLFNLSNYAYKQIQSENLCMAGGVALNCVANGIIHEKGPFKKLFIQPAANDAGTAIGAAYWIWHSVLENEERYTMKHAYLGPSFTEEQIQQELIKSGLPYKRVDNIEKTVAELLSKNKIVGWFQGAMEFGPRALGNRSLLSNPGDREMRERMNKIVKHREDFRPFAPSVLAEEVQNWFEITKPCLATNYMLCAYSAKEEVKHRIPAVLHVNGTSRVQTVEKDVNPKYHRLITEFYNITGIPMLLNTSFNDREPIVCTPQDAIATFQKAEIDYLVLGDFLIDKIEVRLVTTR
ncbi:carbamoyltransferase family protein [Brevibacillus agri]|uniref:carbamoyltransferase family protein n=1 Tax=Brevibacillus agri TaxID=51101 RepID=UPI003D253E42